MVLERFATNFPDLRSWSARPMGCQALIHSGGLMVWPWPSRQPVERRLWAGTANRPYVRLGSWVCGNARSWDVAVRLVSRQWLPRSSGWISQFLACLRSWGASVPRNGDLSRWW